ncbi:hypothetical protein GCM10007913_27340 [Devosia yakushimensis]|uniref:DUF1127 domain-containing protein n=1 Tax=Devosia yakushimensis TaxID=470028 RepID=A0ABQ5UFC7_9HYPH|nr:hypothetical protein [Devosia yakushimensis]GLQ10802.1 hypothetical protein GCM10007913_27340 [Devosia yakushimensis]
MALSLSGERSVVAATPLNPFAAFMRWIAKAQAARTRRTALLGLLELDSERLRDLGISRHDVVEAMRSKGAAASLALNAARAGNARR